MTIEQFIELDDCEKMFSIWSGKHLATRLDKNCYVELYLVEDFYVEIFFDTDKNAINKINAFYDTEKINPYLDELNLNAFI